MEKSHLTCQKIIANFLKPNKRNHYKTIDIIDHYLHLELSDNNIFDYYSLTDKFKKVYIKRENNYSCYSNHRVLVYFIQNNIRFDMPIHKAKSFPIVKNILEGKFKEKPLRITYYDRISKQIIKGPFIVIVSLPIESIVFEDGSNLISKITYF